MAAEAILSAVFQQLTSITIKEAKRQISLVGDVGEEVDKLRSNLKAIQAVLFDAEQRQVKEQSVRLWLDKLKDTSYDMEDVLDEWNTELMKMAGNENADLVSNKMKQVCFFFPTPCFGIKEIVLRRDIALKIKEINRKLDSINKQKNDYHFNEVRAVEKSKRVQKISFVDESEIYGRNDEKNCLVSELICESSMAHQSLHVISIVGMGGIGKTTLAQLAYNNNEVISYFQKRVWVCVSDPFDEIRIAKAIIKALNGNSGDTNSEELEYLMHCIRESIIGKKLLLVLDDVWTEDYNKWEPFYHCLKNGVHGSKILITTRHEAVARMMESIRVMKIDKLSKEYCQSLFKRIAFSNRSSMECKKLEEIGEKIVEKCKGLPLAIKVIGSLLRDKETREEWQLILDNEMWKLDSFERGIFPPLLLSYNDLPSMAKSCFLYCAIFPKDWEIDRNELIHLWLAQGYLSLNQDKEMEIIGKEYFDLLASRSFFQVLKKDTIDDYNIKCKMHDIVHDVALFLSRNECLAIEDNVFENLSTNFSLDKSRHLMFTITKGKNSSIFRVNLKRLRSLLIHDKSCLTKYDQFPLKMEQLTHLRTLRLECRWTIEMPREITKWIYLRFLHLVIGYRTKELPDTLCELYNLQTLRVDCENLKRLPLGMEKLINLRHLLISHCFNLCCMPKGIEKLTCLQTLTDFFVNIGGDDNNVCTLGALKNLNQLRGSLSIHWLGNVKDVSEIKKAELWNKKNLVELSLVFLETMACHDDHEILLQAFQPPPPNLEALRISWYKGNIVSLNWIMSLKTLNKLVLWRCVNWECLPPLGNWLYLESLEIVGMDKIKRVSNEFLGVENGGKSLASSSSSKIIIFPKLKSLEFNSMEDWEEWDFVITRKDEEDITIMPHLQSLKLLGCPKLKVLPEELFQRTTLEELQIKYETWYPQDSNQILEELYEEWSNRKKSQRPSTSN